MIDLPARFWGKVDVRPDGCWLWTAGLSDGYATFYFDGRSRVAHRLTYEALVGPIPLGLEPDHLCRNRSCVRPDHIELVTHRENVLRGVSIVAAHAARTHCPHGHPYDEANTYVVPSGRNEGCRRCRTCAKAAYERNYDGQRARRHAARRAA